LNRKESERYRQDKRLSGYIQVIHQRSRRIYGSPRITAVLRASGISVGRNRVARLMRQQQLEGKLAPRLKGVAGARAAQAFYKRTPNRLLEGSLPKGINRVWVADYTYLRMGDRHIYYAVVMDLYSRRIIGTALSRHRDARMTSMALRRAIRLRLPQAGTIFHSDRGPEYSAGAIEGLLRKRQMLQSMSRAANCYDNAHMESFFHSLKTERLYGERINDFEHASSILGDYVRYYNNHRLHSSLGYTAPVKYERLSA
jgi:putative transposase